MNGSEAFAKLTKSEKVDIYYEYCQLKFLQHNLTNVKKINVDPEYCPPELM